MAMRNDAGSRPSVGGCVRLHVRTVRDAGAVMRALRVLAGARALVALRDAPPNPQDVRVIPAAAGGPKGLVLNTVDQFLFGHWLARSSQTVHLLGASIGAWRMAAACLSDPVQALGRLASDYVAADFSVEGARRPPPASVSGDFAAMLEAHFGGRAAEVLAHPRYRLHVFASRGQGWLLRREGRYRTMLGYLGATVANAMSRAALGAWLERVVFSDPRDPLPMPLADYRSRQVELTAANLQPSILASCSIPFWMKAVPDVPGGPPGAYWDGGITDYHLHLRYADIADGWVLYPHFQPTLVPGWLDKSLRWRHRSTDGLANVIVLAPREDWIDSLPGRKLPDRNDFRAYAPDHGARRLAWSTTIERSAQIRDELAEWLDGGRRPEIEPL